MSRAVCLVSGGLDSCVAAAVAHSRAFELAFLHISYGQRTEDRELQAFYDIADFYKADLRLVSRIDHLKAIGGSALTDLGLTVPQAGIETGEIPVTYVPFRNANLLAIATSWAEVLGASCIFIGAVEEDSSGYPDCREAFFRAFSAMIAEGTRPETSIRIETPLIHLSKKKIVHLGIELAAPLDKTWSCYQNQDRACGRCDSCRLRLRGFEQAGAPDPIPYA